MKKKNILTKNKKIVSYLIIFQPPEKKEPIKMSHSLKIVEDKKMKSKEINPFEERKNKQKTEEIFTIEDKKEIFDEKSEKKFLNFSSGLFIKKFFFLKFNL